MRAKRSLVIVALACLMAWSIPPRVARSQTGGPPNILVIMAGDFDLMSLVVLLSKGLMPNLRRYFLDVGFVFSDAVIVGGLGAPVRASLLTGQYPQNHRVLGSFPPDGGIGKLNQSSTVATWLQAAGYRTGLVGRHVTGYGWWTSQTAIPPGWNDWKAVLDPGSNNTIDYKMNINGTVVDLGSLATLLGVELHQVDVLAWLGADFIRRAPAFEQPFFLLMTPDVFNVAYPGYNVCPGELLEYYDPLFDGAPWGAAQRPPSRYLDTIFGDVVNFALPRTPSFNEADVSDKTGWVRLTGPLSEEIISCMQKRYWRKLEGYRPLDDLIGAVMAALEETGALANTVAIFTGDSGIMDGQHRSVGKAMPFEEAIRVPLLMRTPGNTQPRLITRMALTTDLAPTIAQLAQATPTHVVDGRSLLPLLQNPETTLWRKIGLIQHVEEWDPYAERALWPKFYAVRTDRSRPRLYARYPTVWWAVDGELYDLAQDPYELQNRFMDPARRAERDRLELWLNALKACQGVTCQNLETYFTF